MSEVVAWAASVLVVVTLATFIWALLSLHHIPLGMRPKTPTYNRFGEPIGEMENPDYHENPGEDVDKDGEPDIAPAGMTPRQGQG